MSIRMDVARHRCEPGDSGGEVVMAVNGRFTWFELVTPDIDDGRAFWSEVTGLAQGSMDMGGNTYRMLVQGERPVAGIVAPRMENVPPHWLSYWEFGEIDERADAVGKNGGTVLVAPTDIPVGRIAVVADPQGAVFALFKSGEEGNDPGDAFHWNELWAKDANAVLPFYRKAIGVTLDKMAQPMPDGGTYHLFTFDGAMVGGALTTPNAKAPAMWLPYVSVEDVDAAVARAKGLGGRVIAEVMDVDTVGRFGIVADRQGAVLGLIRPAPR
jgi:predicted enzyme related to lactoylglutathione lyase